MLEERISKLCAAVLRASASLELETVLREIVDSARELAGARYGMITTVDAAGHVQIVVDETERPHARQHAANADARLGDDRELAQSGPGRVEQGRVLRRRATQHAPVPGHHLQLVDVVGLRAVEVRGLSHAAGRERAAHRGVQVVGSAPLASSRSARGSPTTSRQVAPPCTRSVRRYSSTGPIASTPCMSIWTRPPVSELPGLGVALPAQRHDDPGPVRPAHDLQHVARRPRRGDRPRLPGHDAPGVHAGRM